jgi:hypothetical protein
MAALTEYSLETQVRSLQRRLDVVEDQVRSIQHQLAWKSHNKYAPLPETSLLDILSKLSIITIGFILWGSAIHSLLFRPGVAAPTTG